MAVSDDERLILLEFIDRCDLEKKIEKLRRQIKGAFIPGRTDPIVSIDGELLSYFEGTLKEFKTPFYILGTPFQKLVWEELQRIPYGVTRSYADQANALKRPTAVRAVANADGANSLAIVIPCHRIVKSCGNIGGYAGGIHRKRALIAHEKNVQQ